jgi:hypothetical protein
MAIDLNSITKNKPKRPTIAIYGPAGVGKTTFAAQAPDAVFILTEAGLGDIPAMHFKWKDGETERGYAKTFEEVMEAIGVLYANEHQYKTVVIDTLDWFEPLVWDAVCRQFNVSSIEDVKGGYGKGYLEAGKYWERFFDGLTALRDKKDMFVILIAHAAVVSVNDPTQAMYDTYCLKLNKRAAAQCTEFPDIVGFASWKIFTTTDKGDDKRTRGVTTGERMLYLSPKPAHTAKNRFHMPEEIHLAWSEFESHLPKEVLK